jgi:gas vesicle protein
MTRQFVEDDFDTDLLLGLILGLFGGIIAAILFAPKPGQETQNDLQKVVNNVSDEFTHGFYRSKGQYKAIVGKTKQEIEDRLEKRELKKQANRMAEAKRREALETGIYEF